MIHDKVQNIVHRVTKDSQQTTKYKRHVPYWYTCEVTVNTDAVSASVISEFFATDNTSSNSPWVCLIPIYLYKIYTNIGPYKVPVWFKQFSF